MIGGTKHDVFEVRDQLFELVLKSQEVVFGGVDGVAALHSGTEVADITNKTIKPLPRLFGKISVQEGSAEKTEYFGTHMSRR